MNQLYEDDTCAEIDRELDGFRLIFMLVVFGGTGRGLGGVVVGLGSKTVGGVTLVFSLVIIGVSFEHIDGSLQYKPHPIDGSRLQM